MLPILYGLLTPLSIQPLKQRFCIFFKRHLLVIYYFHCLVRRAVISFTSYKIDIARLKGFFLALKDAVTANKKNILLSNDHDYTVIMPNIQLWWRISQLLSISRVALYACDHATLCYSNVGRFDIPSAERLFSDKYSRLLNIHSTKSAPANTVTPCCCAKSVFLNSAVVMSTLSICA